MGSSAEVVIPWLWVGAVGGGCVWKEVFAVIFDCSLSGTGAYDSVSRL